MAASPEKTRAAAEHFTNAAEPLPNGMEREITVTRILDAPRDLVFRAWTDRDHLARWWGPQGWTNPVCEADVRVGGAWRIVMRAPDGGEYPCGGVYREVIVPERLVFTNIPTDNAGNPLLDGLTTVTFADQGGKTKLSVNMRAKGLVPYASQMLKGMELGWAQSLERLEAALPSATADRELVTTRVFDAPRDLVFQMWTDPKHVGRWWGPNGFTTTTEEIDVRPGGVWRFVMHGPDGVDYPNHIAYREVVKPERLTYLHGPSPLFDVTVTFVDRGGKTELTMRAVFETAAQRDHVVRNFGAAEGAQQHLARLAEFLAGPDVVASPDILEHQFVFSRVLDAPRDLVWKAVTESDRLMHWWGPKGFTMLACTVDLRPGGVFRYGMQAPNGMVMWGQWVYRDIVPPERLVTVVSFTDEAGNLVRHPLSATWPLEVLNTLVLEEHDGKTTMTIYGTPINATEAERKTFEDGRGSMKQGFTGTLDQLAAYLAKS